MHIHRKLPATRQLLSCTTAMCKYHALGQSPAEFIPESFLPERMHGHRKIPVQTD